jgi:hypothetical protein
VRRLEAALSVDADHVHRHAENYVEDPLASA